MTRLTPFFPIHITDGADRGNAFTLGVWRRGTAAVPAPADTQGTINGNVVKGPLSGATVTAYAVNNGVTGIALGSPPRQTSCRPDRA